MMGGKRVMNNEGIIDEAAIEELLAVANKELFATESEVVTPSDNDTNQLSTEQRKSSRDATSKNILLAQILEQPHLKRKLVAVVILLCICMASGGYLGYQKGQQILVTPLPLDKIIQQGITFEEKNLVTYAGRGDKEVVIAFLDAGMEIDAMRNTDGWTALTAASFYKRTEIVKFLLEKQATVNLQDIYGRTPLMYAAAMGAEEIVTMLLDAGAKPNIQDKKGRTALMEAYSKQEALIAQILKNAGATSPLPITTKIEERSAPSTKSKVREEFISPSPSAIPEEIRLTTGRAGYVHIGMSLEDLQKIYPTLTLHDEYINGSKERIATINLNGSNPSLRLELSKGKIQLVSFINIYDACFSSDKNITLKSTVGDIRNQYSISDIRVIDNSLYLVVKSMKMLFGLDINIASSITWIENNDINAIPPDTKISRIIMY